jgi:hypothetical protein
MKQLYIPVFIALATFTGCSVYKNNPTPDDVYYSPGTPAQEYASAGNSSDYYSTPSDNYIQMRVQDPDRWSYFDDYNYDYYGGYSGLGYASPYSMGLGLGFGYSPWIGGFGYYNPYSYWNSYYAWNNFYNPYYGGIVVVNGKNLASPSYTRLSTFNPASYQSRSFNSRPANAYRFYNGNTPANNSSQNIRQSYNGNNYYNQPMNNNAQPVRTAPSNFGGGGGGAFRGGGGGRPGR